MAEQNSAYRACAEVYAHTIAGAKAESKNRRTRPSSLALLSPSCSSTGTTAGYRVAVGAWEKKASRLFWEMA